MVRRSLCRDMVGNRDHGALYTCDSGACQTALLLAFLSVGVCLLTTSSDYYAEGGGIRHVR